MTDAVPAVVTRYLAAASASDVAALAACFTPEGQVLDEGHTYRGRAEIIAWREGLAGKYTFTTTVTGQEPGDPGEYRVNVRVAGDFPGGVADLVYRFVLRGDLIANLAIVG